MGRAGCVEVFCDWGNGLALVQAQVMVSNCPRAVLPSPAGRFPWVRPVLEVHELCAELTRTGTEQHVLKGRGQGVTSPHAVVSQQCGGEARSWALQWLAGRTRGTSAALPVQGPWPQASGPQLTAGQAPAGGSGCEGFLP